MGVIGLSLFGAALALDTAAAFQILISQPLISCTLIGWLGNDVALGLHLGFLLQLLWLSHLPVGAAIIPEGNPGSIIAAIVALELKTFQPVYEETILFIVVLYALLMSIIGAKAVTLLRNWNIFFLNRSYKKIDLGQSAGIGKISIMALSLHFGLMWVVIFAGSLIGSWMFSRLIPAIPEHWNVYARYVEFAIFGTGLGWTLNMFKEQKFRAIIAIGALIGILVFWL